MLHGEQDEGLFGLVAQRVRDEREDVGGTGELHRISHGCVSFAEDWVRERRELSQQLCLSSPGCFLAAGGACGAVADGGPSTRRARSVQICAGNKRRRSAEQNSTGAQAPEEGRGWTGRSGHVQSGGQQPKNVVDKTGPGRPEPCDGAHWTRQPAAPADARTGASPASMLFGQAPRRSAEAGPCPAWGRRTQVIPAKPLRKGGPPPVTTAPPGHGRRTASGDRPDGPDTASLLAAVVQRHGSVEVDASTEP